MILVLEKEKDSPANFDGQIQPEPLLDVNVLAVERCCAEL